MTERERLSQVAVEMANALNQLAEDIKDGAQWIDAAKVVATLKRMTDDYGTQLVANAIEEDGIVTVLNTIAEWR